MSLFRGASVRALDGSDSGTWWAADTARPMGATSALSVIPVYAAVRLISETIASLPIHAYRKTPKGRQRVDLPRFIASPVDGSTTVDWVQRAMTSLLIQGNAYGYVTSRDQLGCPTGVHWVDPGKVAARVKPGEIVPSYTISGVPVDAVSLLHIPAVVVPGSPVGVNPIRAFATTLDGAREVQEARRQFAKRRQVPGATLRNTNKVLLPDESDAVAARAEQKIRHGGVFAMGKDWDYSTVSIPAADVAFLESIKADANQVASIYTVPPELIGGTSGGSLTYSTVEGQLNWILTMTTRTWITKLEAAFNRLTPAGDYLKFAPDAVVRTDTATRYATYKIAREIGLRSIDELRELEDLEPLPDGLGSTFDPLGGGGRTLSAAEVSQKVYLAVSAGVLSPEEGRELIRLAGADIDPKSIPPRPVVVGTQTPGGLK